MVWFCRRLMNVKGKFSRQTIYPTNLLSALRVPPVDLVISNNTLNLWRRACLSVSPFRDLCVEELCHKVIAGTILHRVKKFGVDPVTTFFNRHKLSTDFNDNGIVDSIRTLLQCPTNTNHKLLQLLLKFWLWCVMLRCLCAVLFTFTSFYVYHMLLNFSMFFYFYYF